MRPIPSVESVLRAINLSHQASQESVTLKLAMTLV